MELVIVNIWDTGISHLVLKDSLSTKIEWKIFELELEKKNRISF